MSAGDGLEKKINLGIGVGRRTRDCETLSDCAQYSLCNTPAQCSTKSTGPRKCSPMSKRPSIAHHSSEQ